MRLLLLKDVPRFECLLEAAQRFPALQPAASEAFLHLLHTSDSVFASKADYLARHGLSQGRFSVLMLLTRRGHDEPVTQAELAEEAAVTRATMTGLIDTLERDDLVARETDPKDRRASHVRLTKKGRALMRSILPGFYQRVAEIMQPLSQAEQKQLVRLLRKLQSGLGVVDETKAAAVTPGRD